MAEYRNPKPTVDVLIELSTAEGPAVVLIARKNPPFGWAIPGGFVDEGECLEHAARREAEEETGLQVHLRELLHVYSDPSRDPRLHTISAVFTASAEGEPVGADDAEEAAVIPLDALAAHLTSGLGPQDKPFAFDHAQILQDWLRFRATGERPALK
jgi:8-oxo-dGTP diphosphatase